MPDLQVICGDCYEFDPPEPAKLVIADPPYNLNVDYGEDEAGVRYDDALSAGEYEESLWSWCGAARGMAAGVGVVAFLNHARNTVAQWEMLTGGGMGWAHPVIVHESFAEYQGDRNWTLDWRILMLWSAQQPVFASAAQIPWDEDGTIRVESARLKMKDARADPRGRIPGSVWPIRRLQGTSKDRHPGHACQVAPELWERLMLAYTEPGDLVVDLFCGVGGSGLVAQELGRRWIGIDRNPEYCRQARERLGLEA